MKREFYSTSLVEAKGRGEIYKDDVKILDFENDLTFIAKKDIINLICGTDLNTLDGMFPTKTKLQSLNQIGLVCLRIDKDHDQENNNTTAQTLLGYTNTTPTSGYMNAYTGDGETANDSLANKQFVHEGTSKLRKFGRCINTDEGTYRDMGEGFGIGRPLLSDGSAYADKDDKSSKFASSITVGFNDVTFGINNLILDNGAPGESGQEYLVWSDLYGSGGNDTAELSDFIEVGSGANDGYSQTSGLIEADLEAGKSLIQYRADWNVVGSGTHAQTAQQLGHLLTGERCILVGAYLMEHTNVEAGIGHVNGQDDATVYNTTGSTRVFNLDVTQTFTELDQIQTGEQLLTYHDVYWTQNSIFSGKYLTEQSSPIDIVQITPDDTVKGTYTIDFTPASGKFGHPNVDSDVWSGLNCARLGTEIVPTIVSTSSNGGVPTPGVQGCCDWSVALAEKFWSISADSPWHNGIPQTTGPSKPAKLVEEFTAQEWFPGKNNPDGIASTGSLMAGRITHVAVSNASGFLISVVDVTQAGLDSNQVTWDYDIDADITGTYSNTCAVDFGNIETGAIKNRLFFYSAGDANVGGNHIPEPGDPIDHTEIGGGLKGGMFPIHVSLLKASSFNDPDDNNATIPTWNSGDKLIINFKIQWG